MKKKAVTVAPRSLGDKVLTAKSNEAYKTYINELKEVKQLFREVLEGKSLTIELDAKTSESLKNFRG